VDIYLKAVLKTCRSWGSSDSIATSVQFPAGMGIFSLYHHVQTGSGAPPPQPIKCVPRLFPWE